MEDKVRESFNKFLEEFEESSTVKKYKLAKQKVLENPLLLEKLEEFHHLSKYDENYLPLKRELLRDEEYQKYLSLEQELFLWTLEMNQGFKKLLKGRKRCG